MFHGQILLFTYVYIFLNGYIPTFGCLSVLKITCLSMFHRNFPLCSGEFHHGISRLTRLTREATLAKAKASEAWMDRAHPRTAVHENFSLDRLKEYVFLIGGMLTITHTGV